MFFQKMFRDGVFWRTLIRLAIPIALQNLLSSSLAIVDNVMIGKLGDIPVGAIGVSAQIAQLVNIFLFGITAGGTVFGAQYWGKKDRDGIRRTLGLVVVSCLTVSILASLLITSFPRVILGLYTNSQAIINEAEKYLKIAGFSYTGISLNLGLCTILRSTEEVHLPVISNIVAFFVNVFLNAALIFGLWGFPALGVRGAAIGTLSASIVNPLFILLVSYGKKNILRCTLHQLFSFPAGFVSKFFAVSLPVFFNEVLWSVGVAGTNMVFGRMGESNIAALTITKTVENIAFVFMIGLCNACGVMIGMNIGKGDPKKAHLYAKRFLFLVPAVCLVIGWIILLLRQPILSFFTLSPQARSSAMHLLLIYGMEMPLRNIPYISIVGIFRPGGDTKMGMIFDLASLWSLALPLTILLGLVLKIPFVFVYLTMLLSEDIPKVILCIRYTLSGKWIRAVT